jgi:Armadillo/beta-catenin-like repeat
MLHTATVFTQTSQQIEYLVKQGCVPILGELLSENSMVMMALEGLERVLQVCVCVSCLFL